MSKDSVPDSASDRSQKTRVQGRSDFTFPVKYCNNLPEIPFDPKFLSFPYNIKRFAPYSLTSVESTYKYGYLTEPDMGIDINLIFPEFYEVQNKNGIRTEKDEQLLIDHDLQGQRKQTRKGGKNVSWLRKTEYLSSDFAVTQSSSFIKNSTLSVNDNAKMKEITSMMDPISQIKLIEQTFIDSQRKLTKHHKNKDLTPVAEYPLFPDFEGWKNSCAHVMFDSHPVIHHTGKPASKEELDGAILRGMSDEHGHYVSYYTKKLDMLNVDENTSQKEDSNEFVIAREYNWNFHQRKAGKDSEDMIFIKIDKNSAVYSELATRVIMSKRRIAHGKPSDVGGCKTIIIQSRPCTLLESSEQDLRLERLEVQTASKSKSEHPSWTQNNASIPDISGLPQDDNLDYLFGEDEDDDEDN